MAAAHGQDLGIVLDSTQPLGLARRGWRRHANARTTTSQLDGVYSRLLVMGSQALWRAPCEIQLV